MKVAVLFLLFAVYYVECRKVYAPINKNANIDFINMESGGVRGGQPAAGPVKPVAPVAPAPTTKAPAAKPVNPAPTTKTPAQAPAAKPVNPAPATTVKPGAIQPQKPQQPAQPQSQITPVPVNPTPARNPVTTPGPGSVKSLVNFYDSQGKASVIRPYSYSQAVKQG